MNYPLSPTKLQKINFIIFSIFILSNLAVFIYIFSFISKSNQNTQTSYRESIINNQQIVNGEKIADKVIEPITIFFAGDINFDRHVRNQAMKKGSYDYIFDNIRTFFSTADLIVANSEGPTSDNESRSMGSEVGSTNNYFFTFAPETADLLYNENIRLVNIGNNHILNFGNDGLMQTKEYLANAGVDYFGHTSIEQKFEDEIFIKDFDGHKIMFVNYNQFIETDIDQLLKNISDKRKTVDYLIVYTHWGNEYQTIANNVIQELAHKFVDAGADLIIGSHPHVVQQSEIYQDKKIYYSLGNFIFDQYFSKEVREGLIVSVKIDPTNSVASFEEYKTLIELDSSVSLLDEKLN